MKGMMSPKGPVVAKLPSNEFRDSSRLSRNDSVGREVIAKQMLAQAKE
jgi:hypothetical protein